MGKSSLSRRTVLTGLATAPLASLPALGAASTPELDPVSPVLRALIDAHQAASDAFAIACRKNDDTSLDFDAAYSGWDAACDLEMETRLDVLDFTPTSLADVAAMARYFAARIRPINHCDFEDQQFPEALIRALARVEA